MKIYIVDGCDNTGKSTLIKQLMKCIDNEYDNFAFIKYIHCSLPEGDTNEEKWQFQQNYFKQIVEDIKNWNECEEYDAVILDRFVEGEYIYGPMYRNEDPEEVKNFIINIQKDLLNIAGNENVNYISLHAPAEFICRNDDGLSLSNNDIDKVNNEISLFKDVFDFSAYSSKHYVDVSENGQFKSIFQILDESLR